MRPVTEGRNATSRAGGGARNCASWTKSSGSDVDDRVTW